MALEQLLYGSGAEVKVLRAGGEQTIRAHAVSILLSELNSDPLSRGLFLEFAIQPLPALV
jgi:hypothetical protein